MRSTRWGNRSGSRAAGEGGRLEGESAAACQPQRRVVWAPAVEAEVIQLELDGLALVVVCVLHYGEGGLWA
jgi:hypothetical protein